MLSWFLHQTYRCHFCNAIEFENHTRKSSFKSSQKRGGSLTIKLACGQTTNDPEFAHFIALSVNLSPLLAPDYFSLLLISMGGQLQPLSTLLWEPCPICSSLARREQLRCGWSNKVTTAKLLLVNGAVKNDSTNV
ncbi:hypothetical protein AVEN_184243-1 [Araneus ventricosus]|uniref:Uncharacterized protein n=1 Tax=Araneus ventricosus TaxID=182803 RepID=A0A4Y2SZE3_ARAVE|nr:hypothetical protein AVEN_120293-1 [Araneus ventricosus]GBN93023.1 hypothetical protein AVEN_184243-1 [Araneus ventricosus]